MDPITLALIPLAIQIGRNIEQAQIAFNTAPLEYRKQFYERLAKLESIGDPVLELVLDGVKKAIALNQPHS